ncbi:MAG: M3 family oligoendopeptidase [Candidatus Fermentibacteraceae bacterium]
MANGTMPVPIRKQHGRREKALKKFSEFSYVRPDRAEFERSMKDLTARFESARSADEQNDVMTLVNSVRSSYETMAVIGSIRHTMDTTDKFYDAENDALDQLGPVYEGLKSDFYRVLVGSRFRAELEKQWGAQLFSMAELQMKTFSPAVMADLQAENVLASEYVKLKASASIPFQGQDRNLSQMQPFTQSPDREVRKAAVKAVSAFYNDNGERIDSIYDRLVKLRHGIALKLGFENFVPLAYARLGRTDYDAAMVANYRRQVHESIVPLATGLRKRQAARLGVAPMLFFDEALEYLTGNATPKGDPDWILENGRVMYTEMSPETREFFEYMTERGLLDLVTRKGKAGGGYCTYIADEQAPFIFSNFNGTSGDVDVLTHEAGHAFQAYRSRGFRLPEYHFPTLEACEIHSMSMEFLAWPWMDRFFGEDLEKYLFSHLAGALLFIPYGVTVDEFQHWVYENPGATPAGRREAWRAIERKYLPHRDYGDDSFLEGGGYWFRQGHIFEDPFYYIDYTLAQVCAFEFWGRSREDRPLAFRDYVKLCGLGGSLPFTELVKAAGLHDPFSDGAIQAIVTPVSAWLDSVDDAKL